MKGAAHAAAPFGMLHSVCGCGEGRLAGDTMGVTRSMGSA